jgi:hypothetical protein
VGDSKNDLTPKELSQITNVSSGQDSAELLALQIRENRAKDKYLFGNECREG